MIGDSGRSLCVESIRLREQQVSEGLEPDAPAVEAADDAVNRAPFPNRGGVDAGATGQPFRSSVQVVAGVGIASHDGAEVARGLGPQATGVDELERAVRRLERVGIMDIAVHENGESVVVGALAAGRAGERVLNGRL